MPDNLTATVAGGQLCSGLFLHRYLAGAAFELAYELRM
jgi:hypothetical protein